MAASIITGEVPNGTAQGSPPAKVIIDEDHYLYQPKRVRIVGIGAGISGIILAYKAKHEHKLIEEYCDVQMYEVSSDNAAMKRHHTDVTQTETSRSRRNLETMEISRSRMRRMPNPLPTLRRSMITGVLANPCDCHRFQPQVTD
jgi:glycerol dehydrogenase-like iron-containing ADH family enzyme